MPKLPNVEVEGSVVPLSSPSNRPTGNPSKMKMRWMRERKEEDIDAIAFFSFLHFLRKRSVRKKEKINA